jgi:hypothetical protein
MSYTGEMWTNPDGSISRVFTTDGEIGPYMSTGIVHFRATFYDADFDFMNYADLTMGQYTDSVLILGGPRADIISPLPGQVSSCSDQTIRIRLFDNDGIDASSIVINVMGTDYSITHTWVSFNSSTSELSFAPEAPLFSNNDYVSGFVTMILDNLGNPMWDTLFFNFRVDLESPQISLISPENQSMTADVHQSITFEISDNLAGVNPSGLLLNVNGTDYTWPSSSIVWNSENGDQSGTMTFYPSNANLTFIAGDTVYVSLVAVDLPDINDCAPNENLFDFWFVLEPNVSCLAWPNPITPNSDGYNDKILFSFPFMFSKDSELKIFDRRNHHLVFERKMIKIDDYYDI